MSSITRFGIYALAALALPATAVVVGMRSLEERDHPARPAPMDSAAVAKVPRPSIDPTKPIVVILLGADLTEITDALGPYEMFARAGRYTVVTAAPARQPTLLTGGIRILPHYSLAEVDEALGRAADVVVIPNLPNADAPMNRPVIDWIRQQAAAGSLIHSWCKGAMALAETGLLDGHTATAHWGDIPTLEKRYPRVTWVRGVRWIDRGQFVMSAGITSGIDASLRVLIRVAGDSVARRVAREMRYPNYHFALDPTVEPYSLRASDLVLLANAAFRISRPALGVAMYDGVGELDLSNVYDAHVHTMAARVETLAETEGPVLTAHGLTVYPSLALAPGDARVSARARDLDRLIVPGPEASQRARALAGAAAAVRPALRLEYVHATHPGRFGLEAVIEDLARTADVPTARFAMKRMEYRSASVRFDGPRVPWVPLSVGLALSLGGLAAALGASRAVEALSKRDRKVVFQEDIIMSAAYVSAFDAAQPAGGRSVVSVALEASEFAWEFSPGVKTRAWGYNRQVPGPVLQANVGDVLEVRFTNNLSEPSTIHWHGLRLPAPMDGTEHVQPAVKPGETFVYRFLLPDAGTFWYHPHFHETTQLEMGLYGALIVRGPDEPQLDAERVLVVDDVKLDRDGQIEPLGGFVESHDGRQGRTLLINGRQTPELTMAAGQVERWRIVNASSARYVRLSLGGKTFSLLGTDGGLLNAAVTTSELLMTPADRIDIAVGPFAPGETIQVESLKYDRRVIARNTVELLGRIRVGAGRPSRAAIPETMRRIQPLVTGPVVATREVHLGVRPSLRTGVKFVINSEARHHDQPVKVGELQVWDIVNDTLMDHPFHLHGFFFQVVHVNGMPPAVLSWEDTVNIPPRSKVRIAWMPDDRPGEWMYHCHILEHHASGMMAHFEVVR